MVSRRSTINCLPYITISKENINDYKQWNTFFLVLFRVTVVETLEIDHQIEMYEASLKYVNTKWSNFT